MSQISHKFFKVEDANVYKDENNLFFDGELVSENNDYQQQWEEDLRFLRSIGSHKNIARFFLWLKFDPCSVQTLTELCDASLEDYIKHTEMIPKTQRYTFGIMQSRDPREYFMPNSDDLPLCLDLLRQTAQGLECLHDNNIIHRNIQASNVLLTRSSQNKTVAKLGGFRYSRKWKPESSTLEQNYGPSHHRTARIYMASECHEGTWSKESDIFAFGILTYYTLTAAHRHPFQAEQGENDPERTVENIVRKEKAQIEIEELASRTKEEKFTQKSMIELMVDHNPDNRLTIDAVLLHPTFYTPKRKLEFLLKVRESVEKFWTKVGHELKQKIEDALKSYKISCDPERMFKNYPYLTDSSLRKRNGWKPLDDVTGNFKVYLKALRNKVAHACDDRDTPKEFIRDFAVTEDSYNPAKFVEIFVTNHFPKLLVDLYNIYKGNTYNYATEFYP